MNRGAVEAELPASMRTWLGKNIPPDAWNRTWNALADDLAFSVAATLLENDGEAGLTPEIYTQLGRHPSPAVRTLARAATFRGRRWRASSVTRRVAAYFAVPWSPLYHRVLWSRGRG
jgi:hypothetical protein